MNGILNIFKPRGMTSHDVVNILRRKTGIKRIGHTGTLDPMATGVLPICIGKATRVSEYLLNLDKEYIADISLGSKTDTLDAEGQVLETSKKEVTRDEIVQVVMSYLGEIKQVPPMYSALKQDGKKLYELAREGKVVERPARDVTIYDIEILNIVDNRLITYRVKCSRGTYIRTLCDDIGEDLGTFGHMSYLMRSQAGSFTIEDTYSLDYIDKLELEELKELIIPMDKALDHMEDFHMEDKYYKKLINGMKIRLEEQVDFHKDRLYKLYCKDRFIGIGEIIEIDQELYMKMNKVLLT